MKRIFHGDCLDLLNRRPLFDCVLADPPDNLGLGYEGFNDKNLFYYDWLELRIRAMLAAAPIVWISYYWKHDLEIKYRVRNILKFDRPSWEAKTFIWRYTFGQHNAHDAGSGFRFILRLRQSFVGWSPPSAVQSIRQKTGDSRANPDGRIPDDVWDVPRVVGNSYERRSWHPTQHPEAIYEKMLDGSRVAGRLPESVLDCFGGTGTLFRVGTGDRVICEISDHYVDRILAEHKEAKLYEAIT